MQGSGCRVQGTRLRVQGAGCRVQGSGFRIQGSGLIKPSTLRPTHSSPNPTGAPRSYETARLLTGALPPSRKFGTHKTVTARFWPGLSGKSPQNEGGVAGVLGGSMVFRGAPQKFETTFVKQNRKLAPKSGFRFLGRASEQGPLFDLSSKIEVWGFLFGLLRGAPPKSETTFVHHLLILFHKCGLTCSGCALEHHAENPTTPPSLKRLKVFLLGAASTCG